MANPTTSTNDPTSSNRDRGTKQVIIGTLCLIGVEVASTVCYLALRQLTISPELFALATGVVGVVSGSLIKTGVDPVTQPVTIHQPASDPVPVSEAPKAP